MVRYEGTHPEPCGSLLARDLIIVEPLSRAPRGALHPRLLRPTPYERSTTILNEQPYDKAVWLLKCRALTAKQYVDDMDVEEEGIADQVDLGGRWGGEGGEGRAGVEL